MQVILLFLFIVNFLSVPFFLASIFLSIYLISFFYPSPHFNDFSIDAYLISPARRRQCSLTLNTYHASPWSHLIFITYHNTLVVSGIPMIPPSAMHHTYAPCRPPMPPNVYFYHPSSHSQHVIYFSSVDLIWSGFDLILSWLFSSSAYLNLHIYQLTPIDISYRSE